MAKERVWMTRNTGTAELPQWEKYFPKTIVDAIYASDADGESKKIMDLVKEEIQKVVGSAPEAFDTLQEIAAYIEEHEEVAEALQAAIGDKAEKNHDHKDATQSTDGFMSAADKKKLDGVAAGATANDTMYKNQTPSTVAVGGIPAGYVPPTEGIDVVDVVDKLLHAYVAPKATASMVPENGGVCEIGTQKSVTAVTVNLTIGSAAIKKIEVFDGSSPLGSLTSGIQAGANTVTLTSPLTVTANKQLSVKVTDNEDKTITVKTGTFTFVHPYYYGAVAAGTEVNEALITGKTKSVTTKGTKQFTYNCNNERMMIAYDKSYGALAKILDPNNFDVTDTFTQSEVTVGGTAYYVYVNDPATVSNFKMTFSY